MVFIFCQVNLTLCFRADEICSRGSVSYMYVQLIISLVHAGTDTGIMKIQRTQKVSFISHREELNTQ